MKKWLILLYFTHPGRTQGSRADLRRSSIQVVELEYTNGKITCDRNKPMRIQLTQG